MIRFVVRRTLLGAVVMWLITLLVFGMFFIAPNNVAETLAGKQATPETVALISHRLGLDRPLLEQYGDFLWNALHGNLGYDYYHGQSVTSMLAAAAPVSISLALGAAVIWTLLGVTNGVVSAVRPGSAVDRGLTFFALFFYSMPSFLLGLLLLTVFYYRFTLAGLDWFPAAGYAPLSAGVGEWARHLVLPWIALAMLSAAIYTRLTRGAMLDALGEDYIRTARSKGITERRVVLRHGLRSALTPVVTQLGIDLGTVVGGLVVTETVFGLPGLGKTSVDAINNQDLPVIIGVVLVTSAAVVIASIVVDIAYAVLDPRVRLN
ncbi:ABC transporter permease [Mumia sp. zg.B53]|uniref:ABC transporter permease n=1 Tax=unclassified Mumia TaxID=2621872 RepID=UPI001C6E2DCE|nr:MULTISPECIES: ABC transporter permease [unclassified Mumia]MBW9205916.1 ABC transporter permease [Mumia sp. zg.B17]MBW9208079.1 ABC transporter permease [Mumia sp. zg.B21]MBW9216033.1 ABC transporter permease [Mumia sp. zg.B53]MDD9347680.1 ABC transporter permease [Mumia sp.]